MKFSPTPDSAAPNLIDYKSGIRYPTVSITTEIKKDPKESQWLFSRIKSHQIKDGRFDMEVTIVDESGDLVCLSRQTSLILARKTPEELKKIYKL